MLRTVGGSLNHDIRIDRLSPDRPASCAAVSQDSSGSTRGVWNPPALTTFEHAPKPLFAIVTYHFAAKDLSQTNNALERYYFTREYGFTRWEAWVPLGRCVQEHGGNAQDPACDPSSAHSPLRGRCGAAAPIPGTTQFGGQAWVRIDCRDSTAVLQLDRPVFPLAPGMATDDGLVDIIFPTAEVSVAAFLANSTAGLHRGSAQSAEGQPLKSDDAEAASPRNAVIMLIDGTSSTCLLFARTRSLADAARIALRSGMGRHRSPGRGVSHAYD